MKQWSGVSAATAQTAVGCPGPTVRHGAWTRRRLIGMSALAALVASTVVAAPPEPFVLGADADATSFGSRWAILAYTEAFRRMGIALQINHYPLARRAALVDAGEIDGDAGRIYEYAAAHPTLVRVEEAFSQHNFALYTARPTLHLQRLEDLRASSLIVEYRRGILLCENTLKRWVPAERLSNISSEEQGLSKLLAGRTDLYCELDYPVRTVLNQPAFKGDTRIHQVLSLGTIKIYPYLHSKHADLALRLAATLRQMKAEGLIEAYRVQAEKELGWTR